MGLQVPLPPDLPPGLPDAFRQGELAGMEAAHRALVSADARTRALLLLTLGGAHLRAGDGEQAARRLDEGLAITRSHRLARPLRPTLMVGASVAARLRGEFDQAAAHAEVALRARTLGPGARVAAFLALATARRLAGDAWGSLTPVHAALEFAASSDAEVARSLTWLTLSPADALPQAAQLAGLTRGTLRARLAWPLAEQALRAGHPAEARRWLALALADPLAREEARLCPQAARLGGIHTLQVSAPDKVQVLTLERQGVLVGTRFLPVPGDGRLLALLAFLIHGGASHWERVAEAVLGDGSRDALYTQVRHHLSAARQLVGDPAAVVSRRGIIDLSGNYRWSCDVLEAPHTWPARPTPERWLPHLHGWWVQERRDQLRRGSSSRS